MSKGGFPEHMRLAVLRHNDACWSPKGLCSRIIRLSIWAYLKWFWKSSDLVSAEKLHKIYTNAVFYCKMLSTGCICYQKPSCGQNLVTWCVQGVIKTRSLNDMSLCSRGKQRERDSFAEAAEFREGFREFPVFCKSLCGKHFYGTKKASRLTGW